MTLEEAIKVLRQHNVTGASVLRITRGQVLEKDLLAQVLDSCEQLISEKAEYKRLLRLAVKDIHSRDYCNGCIYESAEGKEQYLNCEYHNCFKWRYADEALALIGDEPNGV